MGYAFGDTTLAARRLALLGETFSESTRVFMRESVDTPLEMAADLGCGPGHTTHLLAEALSPSHTVGLDNSESFVGLAQSTASDTVSFLLHDITTGPFPSAPYDLLFSRFILTHMRNPKAIVELWGTQLNAQGLLLIEEVEYIDTANPVFNTYIDIQRAMLAEQSNLLYIGPKLDEIADWVSLKRRSSEVRMVAVAANKAAAMFHMNWSVLRHNDFVQHSHERAELEELETSLAAIASDRVDARPIEWGLRHIVIERAKP